MGQCSLTLISFLEWIPQIYFKHPSDITRSDQIQITFIISTLIAAQADGYLWAFLIGRLVFLNAYPCRPPWGRLSPVPTLSCSVKSENQTHRSDMLAFRGEGKWWRGWLEWIMYIITCLSPEHLAKSLKHCSNHNNQSSCCFSSTVCILNLYGVNLRLHRYKFLRGEEQ